MTDIDDKQTQTKKRPILKQTGRNNMRNDAEMSEKKEKETERRRKTGETSKGTQERRKKCMD